MARHVVIVQMADIIQRSLKILEVGIGLPPLLEKLRVGGILSVYEMGGTDDEIKGISAGQFLKILL